MQAKFWEQQVRLGTLYSQCVEPVCLRHGLTRAELDILLFLANNPAFDTASDIVRRRGISKSHVSASLAALEGRGWLARRAAPGDRRTVHITLGEGAAAAVEDGRAAQRRFAAILFGGFSAKESDQLRQLLDRIDRNVQTHLDNQTKE